MNVPRPGDGALPRHVACDAVMRPARARPRVRSGCCCCCGGGAVAARPVLQERRHPRAKRERVAFQGPPSVISYTTRLHNKITQQHTWWSVQLLLRVHDHIHSAGGHRVQAARKNEFTPHISGVVCVRVRAGVCACVWVCVCVLGWWGVRVGGGEGSKCFGGSDRHLLSDVASFLVAAG